MLCSLHLRVSPHQIWTSFCSTLMVVPIVTLIVTLFKKAKTKEQEKYDKEVQKRKKDALKKIRSNSHTLHYIQFKITIVYYL